MRMECCSKELLKLMKLQSSQILNLGLEYNGYATYTSARMLRTSWDTQWILEQGELMELGILMKDCSKM